MRGIRISIKKLKRRKLTLFEQKMIKRVENRVGNRIKIRTRTYPLGPDPVIGHLTIALKRGGSGKIDYKNTVITIMNGLTSQFRTLVLAHELGHFLDYSRLSDDERYIRLNTLSFLFDPVFGVAAVTAQGSWKIQKNYNLLQNEKNAVRISKRLLSRELIGEQSIIIESDGVTHKTRIKYNWPNLSVLSVVDVVLDREVEFI